MRSNQQPSPDPLSTGGRKIILIILIALALVALYANVQKLRRDKLETVTIKPASAVVD